MKSILTFIFVFFTAYGLIFAQEIKKSNHNLRFFNRSEVSYTFGLNETFPNNKTNALHVKTVLGFALPKVGFGVGLESGSFKSTSNSSGISFNTLALSGNLHLLAKPITDTGLNLFLKGGLGYAVKVFNGYDKGLTYEGAAGFMITTKNKSRYYMEGIYHYQEIDGFYLASGKPIVKSFGIGIGTWF